jgi:hypothetical protein
MIGIGGLPDNPLREQFIFAENAFESAAKAAQAQRLCPSLRVDIVAINR